MTDRSIWAPERRLLTLGLTGLVTAVAFEALAVTTVLPATVDELGGLELYGWAFSVYLLASMVGIALAGRDADHHGPLRALLAGLSLFATGLVIAGLAPTMEIVLLGRLVQGLGAGALSAISFIGVARGYPTAAMPRMIAMLSSAWVLPGLVGPLIAGTVADHLTWRLVFLGLLPILALMAAVVVGPVRRLGRSPASETSPAAARPLDAFILAGGSAAVLAGLTVLPPVAALPAIVVGGAGLIHGVRHLLPPGTLVIRPGRAAAVAFMFLVSFSFFGTETFLPLAVTTVRGEAAAIGGLALTTASVTWAIGSWLQARLAPRRSRRGIIGVGIAIVIVGVAIVSLVLLPQMPVATAGLGWAVAGLGIGLAYSTISLVVLEGADPGREGAASAWLQLSNMLGIALGAGVGGAIVALAEVTELTLAGGIGLAYAVMVAVAFVALTFVTRLPGMPLADEPAIGLERPSL